MKTEERLSDLFEKFLEEYLENVKKKLPESFRAKQLKAGELEAGLVYKFETDFLKEPFMKAIAQAQKEIWKPLSLPKKDCTYQGTCDDGRIICDSIGDDISPEFCHYCRYIAKTYKIKPEDFSEKFFWKVIEIYESMKKQGDKK